MKNSVIIFSLLYAMGATAIAQDKAVPPPPKHFTGNFGAGFSLTGGNTDTKNFNLSFEATHDPKTNNTIKANGLYMRSSSQDTTTADLLRMNFRDDYLLSKRVSVYGSLGYVRDPFKDITYLLNPQGGIGYRVYLTDRALFTLSGGAGGVWEKDEGVDVRSSGTLNSAESFSLKLSEHAKLAQNLTGMWKTSELADALYHFDIGLVTSIVKQVDVKIEFMDEYKNRTPLGIKKNDTALITSFLYKF